MKKTYCYHKPSEQGVANIAELRKQFAALDRIIEALCPSSRERSVALTKLEEAAMWAIKAVVHNDEGSQVEGG